MTERKLERKFDIKKLKAEKEKYWREHEKEIMKAFDFAFKKQQEMEKQVQEIIKKTEDTYLTKVKKLGNGAYIPGKKKYIGRKVQVIILQKEEDTKG